MAKSKSSRKKSSSSAAAQLKPAAWLREKARTLPIGKCYAGLQKDSDHTMAAIVTRVRPSGNLATAHFVIDTEMMGLVDCAARVNVTPKEMETILEHIKGETDLEEKPYEYVHNLIFAAQEFAEEVDEGGCPDFEVVEYILEDDNDDIPMIDIPLGRDGKHYLQVGMFDMEGRMEAEDLKARLGDRLEVELVDTLKQKFAHNHIDEPYSYDYPEYPSELKVKYADIAEALLAKENYDNLPDEIRERVMSLPPDEIAADLGRIILYSIGRTYREIANKEMDCPDDLALFYSVELLTKIRSGAALPALLELCRQSEDFIYAHLGDYCEDYMSGSLAMAVGDNPELLTEILDTPGISWSARYAAFKALAEKSAESQAMLACAEPIVRAHLRRVARDLPEGRAADSTYAGLILCEAKDTIPLDLEPEMRAIFATGCVDTSICGQPDDLLGVSSERSIR